jgi:predicted histidine transporter YuiF (NhaC family)
MILDIFALIVIAILIAVVIWLVVLLGSLPGDIARKRNHPQSDAISALGWIGIITMGVGWLIAMVWAYYKPADHAGSGVDSNEDLRQRIENLENKLKHLRVEEGES